MPSSQSVQDLNLLQFWLWTAFLESHLSSKLISTSNVGCVLSNLTLPRRICPQKKLKLWLSCFVGLVLWVNNNTWDPSALLSYSSSESRERPNSITTGNYRSLFVHIRYKGSITLAQEAKNLHHPTTFWGNSIFV